MSIELHAEDEPVASRVDYWRHLGDQTIIPVEVRVDGAPDFRGRIRSGNLGAVQVTEMTGPPARAARTTLIRRSDPQLCKIDVVARGTLVVEQDGRQAILGPGDLTLVGLSRPARWAHTAARAVAVVFPRALLPLPYDELGRPTGVRIAGDQGAGALVSRLARQLPDQLDAHAAADGPGWAPPWSTCSGWRWQPGQAAISRRRAPSRPCSGASTRSSSSGSPTPP